MRMEAVGVLTRTDWNGCRTVGRGAGGGGEGEGMGRSERKSKKRKMESSNPRRGGYTNHSISADD